MIKPIIQSDSKFERYQTNIMAKKDEAVLADTGNYYLLPCNVKPWTCPKHMLWTWIYLGSAPSSSHGYGWLIIMAIVLIGIFAYWYKYKKNNSKYFGGEESLGLLRETQVNYEAYQPIH